MINARPTEIVALANQLYKSKRKIDNLTVELSRLRNRLHSEWPDEKGTEVGREIKKVEDLNALASDTLVTQFNALKSAYEALCAYMKEQTEGRKLS